MKRGNKLYKGIYDLLTNLTNGVTGNLPLTNGGLPVGTTIFGDIGNGDSYLTTKNALKNDSTVLSQTTYAELFSRVGLIKDGGTSWNAVAVTTAAQITINGIANNGTTFVLVCSNGAIYTTTDGVTYTLRTSGVATSLNDVCYGGSQFVAVGASGVVLTSPDGITWTPQTSGIATSISSVCYSGVNYVLCGASAVVRTSPDAVTWTGRTSNGTGTLSRIRYYNSTVVYGGTANYGYSADDGVTWTNKATNLTVLCIAYNAGTWFLGSNSGLYQTTTDLTTVSTAVHRKVQYLGNCNEVIYSSTLGKYIMVSASGNVVMCTDPTDVSTFESYSVPTQQLASVSATSTLIIAVGNFSMAHKASGAAYSYNSSTQFILPPVNLQTNAYPMFNAPLSQITPYTKAL